MRRIGRVIQVLAVVCVLVGLSVGVGWLEGYVKSGPVDTTRQLPLELAYVPGWVTEQLKERIYTAAAADGKGLTVSEDTARRVQANLEALASWLADVRVRTLADRIRVEARWRKPLALVKLGLERFYVDQELVVLEYVPVPALPMVAVTGLSTVLQMPQPGKVWDRADLAAAVAILAKLDRMDQLLVPDKPLLREIARIDVSNFGGRENPRQPHIMLYAKDNTQIIWGAEVGAWAQHLESTDAEKLAKLYGYYKQCGSLLNQAKYINLRDPRDKIPLPIDKYSDGSAD